jgi:hypothetical protein
VQPGNFRSLPSLPNHDLLRAQEVFTEKFAPPVEKIKKITEIEFSLALLDK